MPGLGDIASTLLEPLQEVTEIMSTVTDAIGEGVEWTAEQIEEFSNMLAAAATKISELQAALRGMSGA